MGTRGHGDTGTGGDGRRARLRDEDTGTRGHGDMGTRGHGDTGTRGHGDTGTREYGDTGTRGHGDMGTRGHGDTGTRGHGDTGTRGHGDTGTRGHGDTGTRGHGDKGTGGDGRLGDEDTGTMNRLERLFCCRTGPDLISIKNPASRTGPDRTDYRIRALISRLAGFYRISNSCCTIISNIVSRYILYHVVKLRNNKIKPPDELVPVRRARATNIAYSYCDNELRLGVSNLCTVASDCLAFVNILREYLN